MTFSAAFPVAFPLSASDGGPVIVLRPAGAVGDPALEAGLVQRLAAEPDADLALAGDAAGSCAPGVWLLRRLQTGRPIALPVLAARAEFVARVAAALPCPPPVPSAWGLALTAAGRVAVVVAASNEGSAAGRDAVGEAEEAGLIWLRGVVGRLPGLGAAAAVLRPALALALADRLCARPAAASRAPAPTIRRLIAGLPTAGMRRMGRAVLRTGIAAAAETLAARAENRAVRRISGLYRGGSAVMLADAVPPDAAARWGTWTYIGTDGARAARLKAGPLAGLRFEPAEPALADVAFRRRAAVSAAWAGLMDARPNRWAAMLADFSPDTAPLALHVAHVLTALELSSGRDGARRLVVMEQPALFRVVVQALAPDPGEPPPADLRPELFQLWRRLWRQYRRGGRRLIGRLEALAAARRTRPAPPLPAAPDVLMVSYVDARAIDADGVWRDRYFGDLPDWLAQDGRQVVRLWFDWALDVPAAAAAGVAARQPSVLLYGELAGARGVIAALFAKFNAWRAAPWMRLTVDGVDLGGVLRLDLRWAAPMATDIDRLLFRDVGRGLTRAGVRPRRIVYPFENQGWERMLCAGVRRSLPGVPLAAYVHAAYSPYCLAYLPTAKFWASAHSPDRVCALGDGMATALLGDGYPRDRVAAGGALRYAGLFAAAALAPAPAPDTGGAILVALPSNPGDALELLRFALAPPIMALNAPMAVKPHPTTVGLLRPLLAGLPPQIRVLEGSMDEAVADCACAVYSGGASVLDLLAHGRPVVVRIGAGRLPFFRLPPCDAVAETGDPTAAAARLGYFLALGGEERAALAAQARRLALQLFSPPDRSQTPAYLGEIALDDKASGAAVR